MMLNWAVLIRVAIAMGLTAMGWSPGMSDYDSSREEPEPTPAIDENRGCVPLGGPGYAKPVRTGPGFGFLDGERTHAGDSVLCAGAVPAGS